MKQYHKLYSYNIICSILLSKTYIPNYKLRIREELKHFSKCVKPGDQNPNTILEINIKN